jgi:glutaredoxin
MSDGFFSLRNAPAWWFSRRAWAGLAVCAVLMLGSRFVYGPQRVPAGQVVFYGTAWCPYSQALREHLVASKIPFVERDIEASFANFQRYLWAAGRGGSIPVVQVGSKVVSKGFYRAQIDDALKAAGLQPATGASGPEGASERR